MAAESKVTEQSVATPTQNLVAPSQSTIPPSPISKCADYLANHGITFTAVYVAQPAADPWGGQKQGAAYAGQVRMNSKYDLNKLIGLKGATVNFTFTENHGENLTADKINNSASTQAIWAQSAFQLNFLTYNQVLFHDRMTFEAGRTVTGGTFWVSTMFCQFSSLGQCNQNNIMAQDTSKSPIPSRSGRLG
jgi:porin